jgi:hypothetical protein
MPTALDFLKARVQAYKHTLEGKSGKEKDGRVSVQTAQQFNGIVDEVKKQAPDAAPHLPPHITWNSPFAKIQQADATFLDLEIMVNQVLAILDVVGRAPA